MSTQPFEWFTCPFSKNGEQTRWDVCINRRIEAVKNAKRSKCNKCKKPEQCIKVLVMEIL